MKKIISIVLCAAMIFTGTTFAFADDSENESMKKALTYVKERIGNTDSFDRFSSYTDKDYYDGEKTVYRLNWENSENGESMNICVTDTGIIESYSYYSEKLYSRNDKTNLDSRPTRQEALDTAKQFVKKMNPDLSDKFVLTDSNGSFDSIYSGSQFYFTIDRYENSYPLTDDKNGYICVSSDAKTVINMDIRYTEGLDIPGAEGVIGADEAKKAFAEKMSVKLKYVSDWADGEQKVKLVYVPDFESGEYIDAFTGEKIKIEPRVYYRNGDAKSMGMAETENAKADTVSFSEAEINHLDEISGLIGQDKAMQILTSNPYTGITKDFEITDIRTFAIREPVLYGKQANENEDEKNIRYNLNLKSKADKDGNYWYAYATMDARTGEITSFSRYFSGEISKDAPKIKNACETAKKAITSLDFGKLSHFVFKSEDEENGAVSYVREENGIPFDENQIHCTVNLYDGKISYYGINYSDLDFVSPEGVTGEEKALDFLFSQVKYAPEYAISYKEGEDKKQLREVKLVYVLNDNNSYVQLDAFTGKVISQNDAASPLEYNDIDSHYAADAIKTLARYGIGYRAESFCPSDNITQKEFVAFVLQAIYRKNSVILDDEFNYDDIYKAAIEAKIIDENAKNPDSSISRKDAAKIIVSALGYGDIAAHDDIFAQKFYDVYDCIGYVNILSALGIVSGTGDGAFNPDGLLCRGDSAIIILNTLKNVRTYW